MDTVRTTKSNSAGRSRRRSRATLGGYLALGLSLIVAAGGWAQVLESGSLYGVDGPTVPFPSFTDPLFVLVIVTPCAILVSVIVDIVAGARGGPNRVLAIVGGVFLFTPVIGLVIAIAGTILPVLL